MALTSPTLVLMYHRVAGGVADPFRLCVSPSHFAEHLAILRSTASLATPDCLARRRRLSLVRPSRQPGPRVILTFDDGYADTLIEALPAVEAADVPITAFITTSLVGDARGFWWDRLAAIFARYRAQHREGVVELRVEISGHVDHVRVCGAETGDEVFWTLHRRLRPRPAGEIEAVLGSLAAQLRVDDTAPVDARPLTGEELESLAASSLVTIGAHTTHHELLAAQPVAVQRATVESSRPALEKVLGQKIRHFAYPFGDEDAVSDAGVDAVRRAGFLTALTTIPVQVTEADDRYRIPRIYVDDWDGEGLLRELNRWGIA